MVTSGALAGLAVTARALLSPGDRVLLESPTYPNAIDTLRRSGARPVALPLDRDGWDVGAADAALRQTAPRAAYLIPDFHNPTGALMPDAQRAALGDALAGTHTVGVVDETLVDLAHDPDLVMPRPARGPPPAHGHSGRGEQVLLGRPARRLDPGTARADARPGQRAADPRPRRTRARAAGADRPARPPRADRRRAPRCDRRHARRPGHCVAKSPAAVAVSHAGGRAVPVGRAARGAVHAAVCGSRPARRGAGPRVRSSPSRAAWSGSCGCPSPGMPPDVVDEAVERLALAWADAQSARPSRHGRSPLVA